jgi:hypothetical protein
MTEPSAAPEHRTPALGRESFFCPACNTYAHQMWSPFHSNFPSSRGFTPTGFSTSRCTACGALAVWREEDRSLIFPRKRVGPQPHVDMPPDVHDLYEEAREVSATSRKSAAALLRLALQVLIDQLEPGKASINDKIGALVRRGLDPQVQQAMDVLRVVGNNAVHPGTIDLDQDEDLLPSLFGLLNLVVEQVITRPKHVAALFGTLPTTAQAAIAKRDASP